MVSAHGLSQRQRFGGAFRTRKLNSDRRASARIESLDESKPASIAVLTSLCCSAQKVNFARILADRALAACGFHEHADNLALTGQAAPDETDVDRGKLLAGALGEDSVTVE